MSHIQFTRDSRVELAILLRSGQSHRTCAGILGMSQSSVSREVSSNRGEDGSYRGGRAHRKAMTRRKEAKKKYRLIQNDTYLRRYIVFKLKKYWSPEQIAGRLNKVNGRAVVCHETIYSFIYESRSDLSKYLRHGRNKQRRKHGTHARISRS